jgi:hypothetical protein
MRITIKTNVNTPEIPQAVELEEGSLHDVILAAIKGTAFARDTIDAETGDFDPHGIFELYLNEVPYYSLDSEMDTPVKDGDIVRIFILLWGGG